MDDLAMITGFYGMKCDAVDCDWSDMSVPREKYPEYRNRLCPKCGANLLTDEDWQMVLNVEAATEIVRANAEKLGIDLTAPGEPFDVDFDDLKQMIDDAARTQNQPGEPR